MRICFHIDSLRMGGAEFQLVQVAKGLDRLGDEVEVVTLYPGGQLWDQLRREGEMGVHCLYPRKAGQAPLVLWQLLNAHRRLKGLLAKLEPDIVYSMLDMNNYTAERAHGRHRKYRLVWGLRSYAGRVSRFLGGIRRMNAIRSPGVDLILANSACAMAWHENLGYRGRRHMVIPNGIDTVRFSPLPSARDRVRAAWGVSPQCRVIGAVGSLKPDKDHRTFIRMAAILADKLGDLKFVCVGPGDGPYVDALKQQAGDAGLGGCIVWAGAAQDMPAVYAGLDLLVSASVTEGFSNVIAEAMACGKPCVVTDVGDSALIVANAARVVAAGDPAALAAAVAAALNDPGATPAELRASIVDRFGLDRLITRTRAALAEC